MRSCCRLLYLVVVASWELNRDGVGQFLLSKEAPARISHELLCLLVVTSRDSNRGGVWQLSPNRGVIDTRIACVAQSQVFVSSRRYFLGPQPGWSWAAIPYYSFYCHKKLVRGSIWSCYVSWLLHPETPTGLEFGSYHLLELLLTQEAPAWLNRWFLSLLIVTSWDPNGMELGSYSQLEFLLSQEARARISQKLLCLLVVTPWDSNRGGVWQLSPIRAVIDTRSSCLAQSKAFVSPHRYLLRSQVGWSWAAIPYWNCYCQKRLLRGAIAGCISHGCYFLTLQPGRS